MPGSSGYPRPGDSVLPVLDFKSGMGDDCPLPSVAVNRLGNLFPVFKKAFKIKSINNLLIRRAAIQAALFSVLGK